MPVKNYLYKMLLACMLAGSSVYAQQRPVEVSKSGRLQYTADSLGNRIPDFSYCGYMASEVPVPAVAAKVLVPSVKGDATAKIQAALDYVGTLPVDKTGFRGAVQLSEGTYEIQGTLKITSSGVVLRGKGTILIGAGKNREALIRIAGINDKIQAPAVNITSSYVPVNATTFELSDASTFKAGDLIILQRPSVKEWIQFIGTEHFGGGITALGWKAGERDIFFQRKITAVNGNAITIDVPLTTALEAKFGRGTVRKYQWNGRISHIGIEQLRCMSTFDENNPKDEEHRWMGVTIENATDAWVRQVTFEHFAGSAVNVLETAQRITVEDCKSLSPVSEIGGQRRYSFFTTGGQTLFQRCFAENGYHDFATGYCAPGPNAFVQCEARNANNFSGAIDSWASGVLFDVVSIDGNALRFGNRGQDGQGAGWAAANSLFWNCAAARIDCYDPPGARNYAYGSWAQFAGDGYWAESNNALEPRSFFYAQLAERLNRNVETQAQILPIGSEASSSPTVAQAAALTKQAAQPTTTISGWIDAARQRNPIPTSVKGAISADRLPQQHTKKQANAPAITIRNGWLVKGAQVLTGERWTAPWWSGGVQAKDLKNAKPAITRFVPGRTGKGLTDDLDALTDSMAASHVAVFEQNYGLWYDRRRDDHERVRRMDGEVWPPFYELPFARSGRETAWDGLSKYDLNVYNTWYWHRLKQYADLADQKGLLLIHQNYFQHNIIEAGAHYADFPWRPANNINNTGFPEPPPYAGDKRIFMAEQFYDVTHPQRRALHEKYIRQCLENFKDNHSVIQFIGAEFTGPLHFVRFWLDVVKRYRTQQIIGLSTTKDVQDAVLADPAYVKTIDLIDIRYWHYQADGSAYAPEGGQQLAPRQQARLFKPKKTSFEQVYRAVKEYRDKYPDKAVMYSGDNYPAFGWAVFMAGGTLAVLPALPEPFLKAASGMRPLNLPGQWVLANENKEYIIYSNTAEIPAQLSIPDGNYRMRRISPATGQLIGKEETASLKEWKPTGEGATVFWITRI